MLVLATYRDDELDRGHPLRIVLGGLATRDAITRVTLSPLSAEAVGDTGAADQRRSRRAPQTTGGNPFYVTEVLAAGAATIPPTVRDAVYARVARLAQKGKSSWTLRRYCRLRSTCRLLEAVAGERIGALEQCLAAGLLTEQGSRLAFRHELARIAVEDAQPPNTRAALHRVALAAHQARRSLIWRGWPITPRPPATARRYCALRRRPLNTHRQ